MERIDGPGMVERDGRLSKRLVDYLQRQDVRLTQNVTLTTTINSTITASGNSGDALLAAMYGTNGVQVLGSIETGVEIRGPGNSSAFVPYYIAPSEAFTVPAYTQALYHLPISIDGVLSIDGALVEV